jgi:hypothetical protein
LIVVLSDSYSMSQLMHLVSHQQGIAPTRPKIGLGMHSFCNMVKLR